MTAQVAYYDQKALPAYSNVPSMTPQAFSPALLGGQGQQASYATSPMQAQMTPQSVQPMMPAQQMAQVGMVPASFGVQPQAFPAQTFGGYPSHFAPPDPCASGHMYKTEYGMCGMITAIVCFPIGLIALIVDKEQVCRRCADVRH